MPALKLEEMFFSCAYTSAVGPSAAPSIRKGPARSLPVTLSDMTTSELQALLIQGYMSWSARNEGRCHADHTGSSMLIISQLQRNKEGTKCHRICKH